MSKTLTLRSYSIADAIAETHVNDLPVEFEGTEEECKRHAEFYGYHWKPENNVYGGYYVNLEGHCLLLNEKTENE